MATISYWFLSPTLILSLVGKLKGWDRTKPTPAFDWRAASVDVVIPAKNEASSVALCLSSLFSQDFRIRNVTLVDDASTDATVSVVGRYCELTGHQVEIVRREFPMRKTPAVRELCRRTTADALFVLDADTVLVGPQYLSRLVEELFKNAGVASTCGEVMPLTDRRRREMVGRDPSLLEMRDLIGRNGTGKGGVVYSFLLYLTVMYRRAMYLYLQRVIYDGHLKLFGSQLNPVGCAALYKTQRLRECFDYAEPRVGDNLSMSEDIYIGHFFMWKGYRNVHVSRVTCESTEPLIVRLPFQLYLWGSAFLQSLYYFRDLPASPFRRIRGRLRKWFAGTRSKKQRDGLERRRIREQYRAPWGEEFTRREGRAVGWVDLLSAIEKVSYPAVLALLSFYSMEAALWTMGIEVSCCTTAVFLVADRGTRLRSAAWMVLSTPVRIVNLGTDVVVFGRYVVDLTVGNRNWRK